MIAAIRSLVRYRAAHPEPRLPRAQGALPRQRPRLLLELRQPAPPPPHLHPRLHRDPAEPPAGHPALLPVPLLRDPALDLVLRLDRRGLGRAHRERQPDQEGPLSRRGAAHGRACSPTSSTSCSGCPSCSPSWPGRATSPGPPSCCCPCRSSCSSSSPWACALFLSALTVHFRDMQNILTHVLHLWFFATPILYSYVDDPRGLAAAAGAAAQPDDARHRHLPADPLLRATSTTGAGSASPCSSGSSPSPSAPSSSTACATPSRRKCERRPPSSRRT